MSDATTWHGRRGAVILGPTEHRVARWLLDMTRHGLVTIRMADLIEATHVERSEAYRITHRLRTLGLFGIENDRGGNHHGRRFWRTSIEHDASPLNAARHKEAWSRIVAWARARRERAAARLAAIRGDHTRPTTRSSARPIAGGPIPAEVRSIASAGITHGPSPSERASGGGGTFLDHLVASGLAPSLAARLSRGVQ